MKLCKILATDWEDMFGTPNSPIAHDVVIIAQTPSCDAFLLLTNTLTPQLAEQATVPEGFDFTYCQQWGNSIDVPRIISDLRSNAYPPITNYVDAIVKDDAGQLQAYTDACLAVKAKYPKP